MLNRKIITYAIIQIIWNYLISKLFDIDPMISFYLLLVPIIFLVYLSKTIKSYIKKQNENLINNLYESNESFLDDNFTLTYKKLKNNLKKDEKLINKYRKDKTSNEIYLIKWAHQIKTPLTSLNLALQISEIDNKNYLLTQIKEIENYIDQSLVLFTHQDNEYDYVMENVDSKEFLNEVIKKYKYLFIQKNLSVKTNIEQKTLITDKRWLEFALCQIISNAIKYTDKGLIEISFIDGIIKIKDSGTGIHSEDMNKIFEMGYTGKNGRKNYNSTGVGLKLSKDIIENLRGKISVISKEKEGTTVLIDLKEYTK